MGKISMIGACAMSVILASCTASTTDNSGEYDERAIAHLDLLSETIGGLESVSLTTTTWVPDDVRLSDLYMRAPDKMYIHSVGLRSGIERGY